MKEELYYFIVIDSNGKRLGKTETCTEIEAENKAKEFCTKFAFAYYYSESDWKNKANMFWYFRNGLDYYGLFNDKF